jgi:hypothetical protein
MFEDLFRRLNGEHTRSEVEEELRFHLDLLTEEQREQHASLAEARAGALKQFGNFEQVRDECVAISRRNRAYLRALKIFFNLIFVGGVLVRVFSFDYHVTRIGGLLIVTAILSRLLLYMRLLSPGSLVRQQTSTSLMLSEPADKHFVFYDQNRRTPVERVIFKE